MRRRFHPLRPITWPRWYWYLMVAAGCVVLSATGAWISAQAGLYSFRRMFTVTFVAMVAWSIGDLALHDYKRRRAEK